MQKPSEPPFSVRIIRDRIIGLRDRSVRKSYYPQLRQRLTELERFRFLLDHVHELIFLFDIPGGRILDFNRRALTASGYPPEILEGLSIQLLFPHIESLGDLSGAHPIPSEKEGRRVPLITHCRDAAGAETPVELTLETAHFGRFAYGIIVARDIRRRLEAERASQALTDRLNTLIEAIPDRIAFKDADGRHLVINQAYADALARPPETIVGKTDAEILPPDVAAASAVSDRQVMEEAQPSRIEVNQSNSQGEDRTFDTVKVPLLGSRGQSRGLVCISRDVTELKRADKALRQSENRYRVLFEDSPISLWVQDFSQLKRRLESLKAQDAGALDTHFEAYPDAIAHCIETIRTVEVNRATLGLYETDTKTDLLDGPDRLLANAPAAAAGAALAAMAASGRFELETNTRTLRGRKLRVLVKGTVPPGFEDSWENVFVSVLDMTDRLEAEAEKKLLERQLRQAQKMEAVGTLAGGIAHDFNNILSAVLGYTEMVIDDTPEDSFIRQNMEQVIHAGMRAKELVQQILTFSRQREQELKPVQPNRIIKEAVRLLRASLPATITIRQDIRSTASVLSDATQFHQVLMNLCTNAAHAMREKGGTLTIGLEEVAVDEAFRLAVPELNLGTYLRMTVGDTGVGIQPAILERIFDPFFTTKPQSEGTGMGLSVAHGIVKSHRGAIEVTSTPGEGTRFNVYFPSVEGTEVHLAPRADTVPGGTERILFVDDEEILVEMSGHLLNRLGYQVTLCSSSREALERFEAAPEDYDLVITDMTMPGITGKDLAARMLALRPDVPIILCTGFSEQITEETARQMGIRAFILKPIVLNHLAETIRRVLDAGSL